MTATVEADTLLKLTLVLCACRVLSRMQLLSLVLEPACDWPSVRVIMVMEPLEGEIFVLDLAEDSDTFVGILVESNFVAILLDWTEESDMFVGSLLGSTAFALVLLDLGT